MGRIVPVALVALLVVLGGFWLERRNRVDAQQVTDPVPLTEDVAIPDGYRSLVLLTDEPRRAFEEARDVLQEDLDYHALLVTSAGELVIDLFEQRAPNTVNNFVFLALHRYYDGVPFHRVLEDFMAQTGDPTGTGRGGPGYTFEDELHPELRHDSRGIVSMANSGPDTNGSQFFITLTATPWLDDRHAVFGQVVAGDEVLDDLQRIDPATPSAVLRLDGTLAELSAQGVELGGEPGTALRAHLEERLGAVPAVGQSFTIDGRLGVVGRADGVPSAGFFPVPDTLESVRIIVPEEESDE